MLDTHIAARSYIWVSSNYVARQPIVIVRILIIGCQATMLRDNLLFLYEFLLLGVKQQSCETTYCSCMNSYYYYFTYVEVNGSP